MATYPERPQGTVALASGTGDLIGAGEHETSTSMSWLRTTMRFLRSSPTGAVAALVVVALILIAIFAPLIAPYDPLTNDYTALNSPPNRDHWMGTDALGRDVLTRVMYGLRVSLLVSIASVVLGVSLGMLWGISSGYLGGTYDLVSQRVIEVLNSFPTLIMAMLLSVSLGAGVDTVVIAIGVTQVPLATRITRSVVLSVKETQFVEAAQCIGASPGKVMLRHVTPQTVAPILIIASLNLGGAIFAEASLSFLGVGVPPPTPSLGNMLGGVLASA
ncbi:MAG TPA: ABC transporter permease, partial [Thermomicrobiales bacterium]|nr:ABC transporter permease [Thermomicrobiales bacterium]